MLEDHLENAMKMLDKDGSGEVSRGQYLRDITALRKEVSQLVTQKWLREVSRGQYLRNITALRKVVSRLVSQGWIRGSVLGTVLTGYQR
jgi:Ca2+-binding EF-hand superfamily protein